MQTLYSMREIAILSFQICAFLAVLLAIWIMTMAAAEILKDRTKHPDLEETTEEIPDQEKEHTECKEQRNIELERVIAYHNMMIRAYVHTRKHLESGENNYRKMHEFPLIRKKGEKK